MNIAKELEILLDEAKKSVEMIVPGPNRNSTRNCIMQALAALDECQTCDWIPVSERLPETRQWILCYWPSEFDKDEPFSIVKWWRHTKEEKEDIIFTHWKPIILPDDCQPKSKPKEVCDACKGSKKKHISGMYNMIHKYIDCPDCNGTGFKLNPEAIKRRHQTKPEQPQHCNTACVKCDAVFLAENDQVRFCPNCKPEPSEDFVKRIRTESYSPKRRHTVIIRTEDRDELCHRIEQLRTALEQVELHAGSNLVQGIARKALKG